ncbi:MAG: pilus assembly protein [Deltaproteobacteria bacterium]|nr:MAG: pilus assembly protein [Deltaproteobacteria bacterium]
MKLMLDLNLMLDVVQKRQPHYTASAHVLNYALENNNGCIAAHAITTLHYLVSKYADRRKADELVDWLLQSFTVSEVGKNTLLRAQVLNFNDFEDAVVCACAEQQHCDYIITRNSKDFTKASVAVLTPGEFIAQNLN